MPKTGTFEAFWVRISQWLSQQEVTKADEVFVDAC